MTIIYVRHPFATGLICTSCEFTGDTVTMIFALLFHTLLLVAIGATLLLDASSKTAAQPCAVQAEAAS